MRLKFNKNRLLNTIQTLSGFNLENMQSGITVSNKEKMMYFETFSQSFGIRIGIENDDINKDLSISVPFRVLNSVVRNFAFDNIELEFNEEQQELRISDESNKVINIDIKGTEFDLSYFYEAMSKGNKHISIVLNYSLILEIIKKASYIPLKDGYRTEKIKTVVCFDFKDSEKGNVHFIATDGIRLSFLKDIYIEVLKNETNFTGVSLIPAQFFKNLSKIIKENNNYEFIFDIENLKLFVRGIESDNIILFTQLVDSNYVDYMSVIPTKNDKYLIVNRELLYKNLKSIDGLEKTDMSIVKIVVNKNELNISAQSEIYKAKIAIECDSNTQDFVFYINSTYLLDFLRSADADSIRMSFSSKTSPIKFEEVGNNNIISLIMPVNKDTSE